MAASKRRKRLDPLQVAKVWVEKEEDPPGFKVEQFGIKVWEDTFQQGNGQVEFDVVRDDSGFQLAAQYDKHQQGADNTMTVMQPMSATVGFHSQGIGSMQPTPGNNQTKQRENLSNDQYNLDDSDQDPVYKDGQTDSSDSDGEPTGKRKKTPKRKLTEDEKAALKPLVLRAYTREKKPPTKSNIKKLLLGTIINGLPWLNIKYQVWAMAQQKIKQAKLVTN